MKQILLLILSLSLLISCEKEGALSFFSKKPKDKSHYMMGFSIGKSIKKARPELETQSFLKGINDALKNKPSRLSKEDLKEARAKSLEQSLNKQSKNNKNNKKKDVNMEEQKSFLEKNKTKPSVKVTSSGLQYEVLKEGTGKNPELTNKVEVHYKGSLIDGSEFDSSYKRGQTTSFPLNAVIKGWQEGLALMKEGATYKFYIPSELGYGASGAGATIPPHSTLIFEVELIKVL